MLIIMNEINEIDATEIRIEYHCILNRSIIEYSLLYDSDRNLYSFSTIKLC